MLTLTRRAALKHALAGAAAAAAYPLLAADAFPTRPVVLVIPFSPGAGVDFVGRLLAERLTQKWGVPVSVDNRLGAAGNVGSDFVAKARPDGHTLLFTGPPLYINEFLYKKLPYSPLTDFRPIVKVSEAPFVLLVGKSAPVNNLRELIALSKAKPGQVTYSSGGNGTTTHLAGALLSSMTGTDMVHVPYKAGAQALTDVLGGQVLMTFAPIVGGAQSVKAGLAKALGVTGSHRAASLPDVPTIAESGVPGYQIVTWNGALAPAGTPDAVVSTIATSIMEIARDPAVARAIGGSGLDMDIMDPKSLAEYVALESRKWQKLIGNTGAKLD